MKTLKTLLASIAAALLLIPAITDGAQVAHGRIYCWSLKFHQAEDDFGSTLDLTTLQNSINGELLPYSPMEWASYFILEYLGGFPINGTLVVELPPFADVNDDGFDDFFDVSLEAAGSTTGFYETDLGGGTIAASWSRAAGSQAGTCVLHLNDDTYGDLGSFSHVFEVLEYSGPLSYTPGTNTVAASLVWPRTGNPENLLGGLAEFLKQASDPANNLDLQAGSWTNETGLTMDVPTTGIERYEAWPSNYSGTITFTDGDPNTSEADYQYWMLSIDDPNDSDNDGVPDFSDTPSATKPARRPELLLTQTPTNLWLTIRGDINHLHSIQQGTNLVTPGWEIVHSLTLTNDPQNVSLPLPAAGPKFWRVLAQ